MTLQIYLGPRGYNIMTEEGDCMEFIDGSRTQDIVDSNGKPDLKEAISQCVRHEYEFVVI